MERGRGYVSGLDVLRIIAAICVVAIHSFMEYQNFTDAYTIRILTRWAVPFFFMVTGYFLKEDFRGFARFWFRILCEYVLWTVIYALLCHIDIWNIRNFLSALRSGIIMPFWYFPTLLICVAFVWALIRTIKDHRIILGMCAVLFIMALMGHTYENVAVFDFWNNGSVMRLHHRIIGEVTTRDGVFWGSIYIAIGYFLKVRDRDVKSIKTETGSGKLIANLLIFFVLYASEICAIVYYDLGGKDITVFSIPVTILLFRLAQKKQIPKDTGECLRHTGNGIFLVHYFFLELFMNLSFIGVPLFLLTLITSIITGFIGTVARKRLELLTSRV